MDLHDSCIVILFSEFLIIFTIIILKYCQVVCLFPLHLFGLLYFWLVPSFVIFLCLFIVFLSFFLF